jgi:hypothetical protein
MTKLGMLKQNLKELAVKIRKAKVDCKEFQRENRGWDGPQGFFWEIIKLKKEFRHKHIAYCIIRGRDRNEIEVPAKDNQPDEILIKEILREYTEDVCINA